MKVLNKYIFSISLIVLFTVLSSFMPSTNAKYKCMVQLINYTGEGAYIIVSVLDEHDKYVETLRVFGDDKEWYPDLEAWYAFYEDKGENIDGITGATIAGGERSIIALEIDEKYFTGNNKIRFETAVEDQKYVMDDIKLSLDSDVLAGKHEGEGYIRYIKILAQ